MRELLDGGKAVGALLGFERFEDISRHILVFPHDHPVNLRDPVLGRGPAEGSYIHPIFLALKYTVVGLAQVLASSLTAVQVSG